MTTIKLISCQARNTFPLMSGLADFLGRRLDIDARYEDEPVWQERSRQLHAGEVQLGWICSKPYAQQLDATPRPLVGIAVPVVKGALYQGQPVYYSYLVVHRDHPAKSIKDLENGRVAYNEPNSQSGYFSLLSALKAIGADKSFFSDWIASGAHRHSLGLLQTRVVDAAAIDSTLWDFELWQNPCRFDAFKNIGTIGPFPAPPLVAHVSLAAELRQELTQLLLRIHQEPEGRKLLDSSQISHFVEVSDHFYRPLLEVEAAPIAIGDH